MTYSCDNVEIFAAGTHRGKEYTVADLDRMVANFEKFSTGAAPLLAPPAVLGHEEDQTLLENSGLPAAGWITKLWREGDKLKGKVSRIPEKVAKLINQHSYRKVSAEIYDEPPEGIPGQGMMLRRLALLGAEIPQVKSLADLPPAQLESAEAVFLCNAVRGILPVARLGERAWAPHPQVSALRGRLAAAAPMFADPPRGTLA